jgi:hypothetical protein
VKTEWSLHKPSTSITTSAAYARCGGTSEDELRPVQSCLTGGVRIVLRGNKMKVIVTAAKFNACAILRELFSALVSRNMHFADFL